MAGRDEPGGAVERSLERGARASRGAKDDGEDAVGALAEATLENLAGAVGLGAGNREDVREERWQPDRRDDAEGEDERPADEHRDATAQHGAGPALGHEVRLIRRPDQ
jgi:phage tail tape-measure protein